MKDLDIKDIWKDSDSANEKVFAQPEIDKIIRKGSHSLVDRFIRTLLWEQWINVVILTSLVVELYLEAEWLIGSFTLILNCAFFFYYQNFRSRLKEEYIDSNVLDYLRCVQEMVQQFIKHLKIASVFILALAIVAVYYLNEHGFYEEVMDMQTLLISLGVSILIAFPAAFFLIHLMYGKKASKLAIMIDSLEQEEA